jgi:hypothetical protein
MALGDDRSLGKTKQATGGTPSLAGMPPMVSDAAVQDVGNNQRAAAAGTGAVSLSEMDRAGVSRGKGQQRMASMAQAGADAKASLDSAKAESMASMQNASARQAYDATMRGEKLQNDSLLESLRDAKVGERLAKRGWQQDAYEAMRRGQFGLDSIYTDTTPLISWLMRS